jgi:hypothetical protein
MARASDPDASEAKNLDSPRTRTSYSNCTLEIEELRELNPVNNDATGRAR